MSMAWLSLGLGVVLVVGLIYLCKGWIVEFCSALIGSPTLEDFLAKYLVLIVVLLVVFAVGPGFYVLQKSGTPGAAVDNEPNRGNTGTDLLPRTLVQTPEKVMDQKGSIPELAPPALAILPWHGKLISKEHNQPVANAEVRLDQSRVFSNQDGEFELRLLTRPRDDSLLQVSHDAYVTQFIRFDEAYVNTTIVLIPKMRVIVVDFVGTQPQAPFSAHHDAVIKTMQDRLTGCCEMQALAKAQRDEVVKLLYDFQENRTLYDKETLAKVGNFHGATHGLFGSVQQTESGNLDLECQLIEIQSATSIVTARLELPPRESLIPGVQKLADQFIAQLCKVEILAPKANSQCGLEITVDGYVQFRPETWTLWITVEPGQSGGNHYPQARITLNSVNGSWHAGQVQVGKDEESDHGKKFKVHAVLADPEANQQIEDYHRGLQVDMNNNHGLSLNKWGPHHCKVLQSIEIMRSSSRASP